MLMCANRATYLGTEVEDTFAVIGSPVRISKLQQELDSPPYGMGISWAPYTVHDAAGIFLRYLKSLPEPIIPYDLYSSWMAGLIPFVDRELTEEQSAKAREVSQALVVDLPPLNRQLLVYVVDVLIVFAFRSEYNQMTDLRLISVFQPSIISGPPEEMDAEAHYAAASVAMLFLSRTLNGFMPVI